MKISQLPVLAPLTGEEEVVMRKGAANGRAPIGTLVDALTGPAIGRAEAAALRAEGFALALQTESHAWFNNLEAGAAAVAEGQNFFVLDGDDRFYIASRLGGVGVLRAEFSTSALLRADGIRVLSIPGVKGNGINNDAPGIKAALAIGKQLGIPVLFPGPGYTFLIGDDFFTYGDFVSPHGTRPFPRGIFEVHAGMRLIGQGATLRLSGGRFNPGGLFFQKFWQDARCDNVHVEGLVLDANRDAQIYEAYPANTPDGQIWQHASAIFVHGSDNLTVHNCVLRGWRGNGIAFYGDPGRVPVGLTVTHCEFDAIFGLAVSGGTSRHVSIMHNWVHGDGYWIGAFSPEILDPSGYIRDWEIAHNLIDFRDGLSPPENTPQFASDSAEALAARRHTRRALVAIKSGPEYPGGTFNGAASGVKFHHNIVCQGVVQAFNYDAVEICDNRFVNVYEDLSGRFLSGTAAIEIKTDAAGIGNARVLNNHIDSDLDGHAIWLRRQRDCWVGGNTGRRSRQGGLRFEEGSGSILPNRWIDTGAHRTAGDVEATPHLSCAIALFGDFDESLTVAGQQIIDTRGAAAPWHGIVANVGGSCPVVIEGTRTLGLLGDPVVDTGGDSNTIRFDNRRGDQRGLDFNGDLSVRGLDVAGNATLGSASEDTTITIRSGAGKTNQLLFSTAGGLEYKAGQTPDGSFVYQNFKNGVFQRTDLEIGDAGYMRFQLTWAAPFVSADGDAVWMHAGTLWTKPGYNPTNPATWPQSGTDGMALGKSVGADPDMQAWETITTDHVAAPNSRLYCDTAGGMETLTLPPQGGTVIIRPYSDWALNPLTIDGNGRLIDGQAAIILDFNGSAFTFETVGDRWIFSQSYLEGYQLP